MNSIIKLIFAMTIWGSLGVFVKNIDMESFELAFLRAIIACIFLGSIFIVKKYKCSNDNNEISKFKTSKNSLLTLIISGIFIGLNWAFLFESYKYTTVSNATLSYYFAPVIVVFLSPIILKEKFTLKKTISVLVALGGLFLILSSQSMTISGDFNHTKGISIGLIAAGLYAAVMILNKYIQDFNDYERTFIQLFSAALALLPFVLYRKVLIIDDLISLGLIVILGIVHTGIAYCLYFSAIKDLKAQTTALFSYIDPVSSIIFSILFLGEELSIYQIIGGSIILISTFIGQRKTKSEKLLEEISD